MPKRVIDGEAVWTSLKLSFVEPPRFRAEFANLLPLAYANGSFECHPRQVWGRVYAFNRPDITVNDVSAIFDEFVRVKLLFRWEADGKVWGYWIGIDKPGRLPSKARLDGRHEKLGAVPPADQLEQFLSGAEISAGMPMASHGSASGLPVVSLGLGSGSGFGSGLGTGSGLGSAQSAQPVQLESVQSASSVEQETPSPVEQEQEVQTESKPSSAPAQPVQPEAPAQAGDDVSRLSETLSEHTGNPVTSAWSAPAQKILDSYKLEVVLRIIRWMFSDRDAAEFWPARTHTMQNLCDHLFRTGEVVNGKQQPPALIAQYNKFVRRKKAEKAAAEKTTTNTEAEQKTLDLFNSLQGKR